MVSGTICFDRLLDRHPGVPRLRQVTQEGSVPRTVPRTATRFTAALCSRHQSLPAAIWRMRLTITSKIIAPVKETTRLKPC